MAPKTGGGMSGAIAPPPPITTGATACMAGAILGACTQPDLKAGAAGASSTHLTLPFGAITCLITASAIILYVKKYSNKKVNLMIDL